MTEFNETDVEPAETEDFEVRGSRFSKSADERQRMLVQRKEDLLQQARRCVCVCVCGHRLFPTGLRRLWQARMGRVPALQMLLDSSSHHWLKLMAVMWHRVGFIWPVPLFNGGPLLHFLGNAF